MKTTVQLSNSVPSPNHSAHPHGFTARCRERLAALKSKVAQELGFLHSEALPADEVYRAVREAEALASLTGFTTLFLPALAAEKAVERRTWWERQTELRDRGPFADAA